MARNKKSTPEVEKVRSYVEGVAKNLVDRLYGPSGPAWGTKMTELEDVVVAVREALSEEMLAQALEITWALSSLSRIRNAFWLRKKHPFYATLTSCIPLLRKLSPIEVIRRLFVTAPFVSLLLNPNYHNDYQTLIGKLRALQIPTPKPQLQSLSAEEG